MHLSDVLDRHVDVRWSTSNDCGLSNAAEVDHRPAGVGILEQLLRISRIHAEKERRVCHQRTDEVRLIR